MKRYMLILTGILVFSLLSISIVFATVIFPPTWPSKEMPQEKPPVIIPHPFPPSPPILPGPYPPSLPPPDGWTCTKQVVCIAWCDVGTMFQRAVSNRGYANTGCYANKEDAISAARELEDEANSMCTEGIERRCSGRERDEIVDSAITCSRCRLSADVDPADPI